VGFQMEIDSRTIDRQFARDVVKRAVDNGWNLPLDQIESYLETLADFVMRDPKANFTTARDRFIRVNQQIHKLCGGVIPDKLFALAMAKKMNPEMAVEFRKRNIYRKRNKWLWWKIYYLTFGRKEVPNDK
jgi:hypothetical protein